MTDIGAIQATIGGYSAGGQAVTLMGLLDYASGALTVIGAAQVPTFARVDPSATYVTDHRRATDYDGMFTPDSLKDAIDAFRRMEAQQLVTFEAKAMQFHPSAMIEVDGYEDNGRPKLRINPDLQNGHVAALALCWLASLQLGTSDAMDAGDEFLKVAQVGFSRYVGGRFQRELPSDLAGIQFASPLPWGR